jgi:glutamyl-tRNA reductase
MKIFFNCLIDMLFINIIIPLNPIWYIITYMNYLIIIVVLLNWPMKSNFKVVSISHHLAPVSIRESVSLNESLCKKVMLSIKEITSAEEVLILSTCNRTEVYYISENELSKEIITLICLEKGLTDIKRYYAFFECINDHSLAVNHIFNVSMGLLSQVIGDNQIITQIKQAYQWSADISMAGPYLHRLLHTIFFTNKKVVQTTSFRDGAASISYASTELAESLCAGLIEPKILIIGLGEMGTDVLKNVSKTFFKKITVANRTLSKVKELAQLYDVDFIPMEDVWSAIDEADVIIGSISKPEALITKEEVQKLTIHSYKYFIDISVPRCVEESIEEVAGAMVYNIDHIRNRTTETLEKRMQSIPFVKEIIMESIMEFNDWSNEMFVSPVINKFKEALESIRTSELERHLKNMNSEESEKLELITKGIMQKIIKLPVLNLKAACKRGDAESLIDVLNELFDLENKREIVKVKI